MTGRLDSLLNEETLHSRTRAETAYDVAIRGKGDGNILSGAGGLGRSINRKLRVLQIQPIAFVDNNPALWGKEIDGSVVMPPKEAAREYGKSAVFIICVWNYQAKDCIADRVQALNSLGCEAVTPFAYLFWKYPDAFLPDFCADLPEKVLAQKNYIQAALTLLSDDESRAEFAVRVQKRFEQPVAEEACASGQEKVDRS